MSPFYNHIGRFLHKNRILLVVFVLTTLTLVAPIYHDIHRSYLTTADMDLLAVHDALLLNDGRRQDDVSHIGYIPYKTLAYWFRLSKAFGVVDVDKMSELHNSESPEEQYARLVYSGRVFSMLVAVIFSTTFFFLIKTLTNNSFAAILASIVFSVSNGLAYQSLILRTELLSSLFVTLAFLSLLAARHDRKSNWIGMFLAGFSSILAILSKVQALFPLLLMSGLIVVLGSRGREEHIASQQEGLRRKRLAFFWGGGLLITAAVWLIGKNYNYGRILNIIGRPQLLIALAVLVATVAYAYLHDIPRRTWLISSIFLLVGMSAGVSVTLFQDDNRIVRLLLVDFWSHLQGLTTTKNADVTTLFARVLDSLPTLLSRYVFLGWSKTPEMLQISTMTPPSSLSLSAAVLSRQPEVILQITTAIFGLIAFLHRRRPRVLIICAAFLITPLILELIFSTRYMHLRYLIYIQPWVIAGYAWSYAIVEREAGRRIWKSMYGSVALFVISIYMSSIFSGEILPLQGEEMAYNFMQPYPDVFYIFEKYHVDN